MSEHYHVYGIGNAIVDTEYEVHDAFINQARIVKGQMTLIDQDQRHDLIKQLDAHEHEVIKLAGGGSAANTIVAVAQLGGRAFYSCKVANDEVGDFFLADLDAVGVATNMGIEREAGVTGECISMVTPDAERTMTTCLGITATLSRAELDPDALKVSDYLYIEGYLVTSPTALVAIEEAQQIARDHGVKVALTLSDPSMVAGFRSEFEKIVNRGVDLLFCNEAEAQLWSDSEDIDVSIAALKRSCPHFVMTQGASGAMVYDGDLVHVAGMPSEAKDTTGAGDIFAGTYLHGITHGLTPAESAARANRAAALLVRNFGARLTMEQVNSELA